MSDETLHWEAIEGWPQPGYRGERAVPLYRAAVPGGWLIGFGVHQQSYEGGAGMGGLTFVPDPQHTWSGGSVDRG